MQSSIIKISEKNLTISLMNGSIWRLANVGDLTKVLIWYPSQNVTIEEIDGEFILTNLNTSTQEQIKVLRAL
jgi:hypothetical protein